MANIFLQLTEFRFKRETLEDITGAASNKNVEQVIEDFYTAGKTQHADYANILITLMKITTVKQGKQKLLIALVYFIVKLDQKTALDCLNKVLALN